MILQARLASTLERQQTNQHPGSQEQRATHIHRRRRLQIRIDSDNGRHDPKHAVRTRRQRISRAPILGGEDLGRVGVEHRIHDITHEAKGAIPAQQSVRVLCGRGTEQENSRQGGGQGQGALAAHFRDFDQHTANKSTGNAEDGDDEGIAVCEVGRSVAEGRTPAGERVGDEGVVEGEGQTDESPDAHDQSGRVGQLPGPEQRSDVCEINLFEFAFQGCGGVGFLVTSFVVHFQIGEGEGGSFAVFRGDFMDDCDGFGVLAFAHEELGGFVEGEDDEAEDEADHGEATHGDHEPSPSEVLGPRARRGLL